MELISCINVIDVAMLKRISNIYGYIRKNVVKHKEDQSQNLVNNLNAGVGNHIVPKQQYGYIKEIKVT